MTSWNEAHAAATAALTGKKWNKAIAAIAPWLRSRDVDLDGATWTEALTDLAGAISQVEAAVAGAASKALAAPEDGRALYDLGHALIEARRPDLAVAILSRAVEERPDSAATLAELVAALELQGRNAEVVEALDEAPELVGVDPLLAYLRAFNAVMVADLETARGLLPRLLAATDGTYQFMAARIERMLARADAMKARSHLGPADLRGWHFVLTGGVLLHDARLGRTWDTPARVKAGVRGLATVLDALALTPPAVLYPPERQSELLARACAAVLDRPARVWHGGDERGLVVVYDARALIPDLRKALVHQRAGQPLFMQAAEHTSEQPTAPDFLTYLYEQNVSPWGPGLGPDFQLIDTSKVPVDELVGAVLAADQDPAVATGDELRAFAESLRDLPAAAAPAALRAEGQRDRLWVGSPVAKR